MECPLAFSLWLDFFDSSPKFVRTMTMKSYCHELSCSGLQKPRISPSLDTWAILIAKICSRFVQVWVVEGDVRMPPAPQDLYFNSKALNVLSYGYWYLLDWISQLSTGSRQRTQTNTPRTRIAMTENASYWLVKFGGQLDPFQSFRGISCICQRNPVRVRSFFNLK